METLPLLHAALLLAAAACFILHRLGKRLAHASDPRNWPAEPSVTIEDATFLRHVRESDWLPGVSIYDMLDAHGAAAGAKPVARHVPLNQVVALETEHFVGQLVWMARPTHSKTLEAAEYKYKWHFAKKARSWEIRIQGRFKSVPKGAMYAGIVLADFDYAYAPDMKARTMMKLIQPILEAALKQRMHLSWGSRGAEAEEEDAEKLCLVARMQGIDQVIVTPRGQTPPPIDSLIDKFGFRRNAMKKSAWEKEVTAVMSNLNTEDTYTFCLWGIARFTDLFDWWAAPCGGIRTARGIIPGRSLSLGSFLGPWPARCTVFSIEDTEHGEPQRESRKRYILDLMVLSNAVENRQTAANVIDRYTYSDARLVRKETTPR